MKFEDVLALAGAGLSKEEIVKIFQATQQPAPQPAQQPAPQPAQQPAPQPAQQPAQQPAPDPFVAMMQAMTGKMDTLTAAIQKANIQNTQQPPIVDTIETVMAEIIGANPKPEKEVNNG